MKLYKWPVVHEVLLVLSFVCTNSILFALIGLVNRFLLGKRLTTVYCTYPVNRRYLVGITRPIYATLFKWHPGIVGFFLLKNGGGITVVTMASEKEMESSANRDKMVALERQLQRWTRLMGGTQHTHGGRMPSILSRQGISTSSVESETVASLCSLAVEQVCHAHQLNHDVDGLSRPCPVAIIGANGFVGQRAVARLREQGHSVIEIDRIEYESNITDEILTPFRDRPLVVLNLSRKGVLAEYASKFWPSVYVVDDVYPEATQETREALNHCGAQYYHISGIRATAFPKLIGAYEGVVPFCAVAASHCSEDVLDSIKSEIVLSQDPQK